MSPPVRSTAAAVLLWLLALRLLSPTAVAGDLRVAGLRCEGAGNPVGIEALPPQLGWIIESSGHDTKQGSYRILVATGPALLAEGRADLWDSGRVESRESAHVTYAGLPLASRQVCYWKVRIWDAVGQASAWSRTARWEMGLLHSGDWQARWIGRGPLHEPRPPAGFFKSRAELTNLNVTVAVDGRSTLLRKEFAVTKPLRRAEVYVTGLGYYELSCNGRRVGDHRLAPAKSNYRQWVLYDTYDLTSHLRHGENALGLQLGNGWFNPDPKWWEPYRMQWFGAKRALLQLHLDYTDGTSEVVLSDGSWKTAPGPVLAACVYDGELYDATQEQPGWDRPGFNDRAWQPANCVEPPGGQLVSHLMPPIKITQFLRPVALTNPKPGVYVYDLGQNAAGWARLTMRGPRGTKVTLRYAEDILPDGLIDPRSNERAVATDSYVLKGEGRETYEPRFTFHGFRYVEVTGLPSAPRRNDVVGCVVHTACEPTGAFACGNELINRLHRATRWAQRSNLMGYPMDCPQRDERLGWFGDAMVTAEEALLNFDTASFWQHWLDGIRRNQNPTNGDLSIISPRPYMTDEPDPTWSSAYPVVVWQYYLQTGDRRFLAGHFDSMRRYVDYLGTQATNHVLPKYWIGDWGTTVEGWQEGDPASVGTAFYYYDTTIVAKAAGVLGRPAEATEYAGLAEAIGAAFHRTFYDPQRRRYDQGSQFSNAFPLFLGLVPTAERSAVQQQILDDLGRHHGHFTVGVLGAKYLIDALTEQGRADVAYRLVNQRGYPSWAHLIDGQTTLCEFWDRHGSHNHVMMGSIDAWFYRVLAGIQVDEARPGFEHVIIKPFVPADLPAVRAAVNSVRGRIDVEWRQRTESFRLHVSIPANTTATIYVPVEAGMGLSVRPHREAVRRDATQAVFEVGSGAYELEAARRK